MLAVAVGFMGLLMSLAYFPQAATLLKTKDASNVSVLTYAIFSFGTAMWLIYGLVRHDPVIISSFAVGVIGSWSVLFLTLKYRRNQRH